MSRNPPNIENINEYHDHFRQTAETVKAGPVEERSCNDICCCVLFILLTGLFIGVGFYLIGSADYSIIQKYTNSQQTSTSQNDVEFENMKPAIPTVIGMIILAIVLAIIFMCLLSRFPKCMFYTMLIFTAVILVALMIMMFVAGAVVVGILLLIVLLIYACFLYCSREQIRIGIVLLETSTNFLLEKPGVFMAPIVVTLFVLVFESFWIASMVAIQMNGIKGDDGDPNTTNGEEGKHGALSFLWSFFHIFYMLFFYYCMVFLIATACAMWYYGIDGNYLWIGIKRIIRYHVGSFTFAAIILTIVIMIRQMVENEQRESDGVAAICLCLVACCLRCIEDLIDTLNHNAIIVMAVTGQSYWDCAKSTISLIFQNFSLFFIVDLISSLITFTGSLFICGIPAVIGYFILQSTMESEKDATYIAIAITIIVLVSLLIGALFLGVLSQALSCIFIFYCFDKKFSQMGFPVVNNVPPTMKRLFQDLSGNRYGDDDEGGRHSNNQGGYNQGNQGGYNPGGNQGGYNQGGYNQGGYNQGGYNQGGGGYY